MKIYTQKIMVDGVNCVKMSTSENSSDVNSFEWLFTARQCNRLIQINNKSLNLAKEDNWIEKKKNDALYNKILDAFENDQDTCANCGALFDTRGLYTSDECPSCAREDFERNSGYEW